MESSLLREHKRKFQKLASTCRNYINNIQKIYAIVLVLCKAPSKLVKSAIDSLRENKSTKSPINTTLPTLGDNYFKNSIV